MEVRETLAQPLMDVWSPCEGRLGAKARGCPGTLGLKGHESTRDPYVRVSSSLECRGHRNRIARKMGYETGRDGSCVGNWGKGVDTKYYEKSTGPWVKKKGIACVNNH